MRKVILHYHLFKNAGTSVDELLKRNFGARWVTREFNGGAPAAHRAELARWLADERDAVAFSSHTAQLPPPAPAGVECFPLLFVRHPIDRIASAYAFETKQGGGGFGAVLARNTTLAGYIEVRLSLGHDRQCRNFHVTRLAQMFPADSGDELSRALRAIETLPFVGLVEAFDTSVERMAAWLTPHFAGFRAASVAKNVTRDRSVPLADRLAALRTEVGEALWGQLLEANRDDLAVYEAIAARYRATDTTA
ncbi:MAG TPA: hypothetical protein VLI72_01780 [Methylibium sp.]|nr:hypothetical protein [Methylibium sp.]